MNIQQRTIQSQRYQCPQCTLVYDVTILSAIPKIVYRRAGFKDLWVRDIGDGRIMCPRCQYHDGPESEMQEVPS